MSSSLPTRAPDEIQAAFFEACRSGDLGRVQALLASGFDPKTDDGSGFTALHWASGSARLPVVFALLAAGADWGAVSRSGFTPLDWASYLGHIRVVEALLAYGADPRKGENPLILLPPGREDLINSVDGALYSAALILSEDARLYADGTPGLGEALLSFQGALASETPRGAWVRAALFSALGCKFKERTTESRVEVVPEGPAVGGAGGPGPGGP